MNPAFRVLVAVLVVSLVPPRLYAGTHLVTPADSDARIEAAASERTANRLKVDRLLQRPEASQVAAAHGLDIVRLRAAAATLSDDELRDLAARADALETDPAAGGLGTLLLLVILLVVLLVVIGVAAIESCKDQGAECFD